MSSQRAFQATLNSASNFLQPVFRPQTTSTRQRISIIENLYENLPQDGTTIQKAVENISYSEKASQVIKYALSLLSTCNKTAVSKKSPDALYAPRDQRIILGLADLLLLEGIYPNVTSGILPPLDRRTKSSGYFSQLQAAASESQGGIRDVALLGAIVETLEPILATSSNEVSDAIRERLQMDLVACLGELAFHPDTNSADWEKRFYAYLDGTPVSIVLPLLVPLIQPATPLWFQTKLTTYLSSIPLNRPNGVKDEIMFFIDSNQDISTQRVALRQASRLIGSVPSNSTLEQYFYIIVPQLLELLDDDGTSISTAAAIVINDIFERRKRSVEKYFFPALLRPLRPSKTQLPSQDDIEKGDIITLTTEEDLKKALNRISYLFQSSDGKSYLASHILNTIVLPLWGIWQYAVSIKATDPSYIKIPQQVLTAHVKLKNGSSALSDIAQDFSFDGEEHWTYRRGEIGQVKIIMRDESLQPPPIQITDIEERVPRFIDLALAANDDTFTTFFLDLCRRWLGGATAVPSDGPKQAFGMLFQLKVLEGILEHHSERLTRHPEEVIILIKEILDEHVRKLKAEQDRLDSLQQASLRSITQITASNDTDFASDDDDDTSAAAAEAVNIALQLLNSLISTSFSRTVSEQEKKLLTTLQPSLTYLSSSTAVLPALASLTRSLSLFISTQDIPLTDHPADAEQPPVDEKTLKQQQELQTALLYLRDEMIPIRAHGIELLKNLISQRSSVIDVPAITKLLIDMLQDRESFVYLSCVKALCELSDKHPATVIGMLVEVYVDEKETMGIDERLKIGEALMGTVQRLGETAVGKVAERIGNVMVGLAGRRKRRYKEAEEVKREEGEEAKRIKKEGAMDVEYARVLKEARVEAGIDNLDGTEVKREEEEDDKQWISKVGEEDYRIRTSALSVLGVMFETNASGVPIGITTAAVEVALNILNLEKGKEQATARRAAVHLISSILNGLEKKGTVELLKVLPKERLEDIVRVLGYVRATDDDGLVREQAGVLVDAMTE
ncbi:hypothetical protein TWF694_009187 [Orbilia ellipsospora]|uniref:RNA polymerase II assembly factor Rtp1 C-terminal domain-containing protein n=1 Tax=Orbilia ellipsospora TaxID=2528407 RepID=A0AAV9XEQ4_9PEZI